MTLTSGPHPGSYRERRRLLRHHDLVLCPFGQQFIAFHVAGERKGAVAAAIKLFRFFHLKRVALKRPRNRKLPATSLASLHSYSNTAPALHALALHALNVEDDPYRYGSAAPPRVAAGPLAGDRRVLCARSR